VLQLYSFDSGYSLDVLGKEFLSVCGRGGGKRLSITKKKSLNIAFHFFLYYHKINLHLGISIFVVIFSLFSEI
jgi:hypothetical protein